MGKLRWSKQLQVSSHCRMLTQREKKIFGEIGRAIKTISHHLKCFVWAFWGHFCMEVHVGPKNPCGHRSDSSGSPPWRQWWRQRGAQRNGRRCDNLWPPFFKNSSDDSRKVTETRLSSPRSASGERKFNNFTDAHFIFFYFTYKHNLSYISMYMHTYMYAAHLPYIYIPQHKYLYKFKKKK